MFHQCKDYWRGSRASRRNGISSAGWENLMKPKYSPGVAGVLGAVMSQSLGHIFLQWSVHTAMKDLFFPKQQQKVWSKALNKGQTNILFLQILCGAVGFVQIPLRPISSEIWYQKLFHYFNQILKKVLEVSELEEELQSLISNSKTTVKNLEDFIRNNSKDLHTKHYLNLMGKKQET